MRTGIKSSDVKTSINSMTGQIVLSIVVYISIPRGISKQKLLVMWSTPVEKFTYCQLGSLVDILRPTTRTRTMYVNQG